MLTHSECIWATIHSHWNGSRSSSGCLEVTLTTWRDGHYSCLGCTYSSLLEPTLTLLSLWMRYKVVGGKGKEDKGSEREERGGEGMKVKIPWTYHVLPFLCMDSCSLHQVPGCLSRTHMHRACCLHCNHGYHRARNSPARFVQRGRQACHELKSEPLPMPQWHWMSSRNHTDPRVGEWDKCS